jgi:hypothetical protein
MPGAQSGFAAAPNAAAAEPAEPPGWKQAPAGVADTLRSSGFQFKSLSSAPSPSHGDRPKAVRQAQAALAGQPGNGMAALFQNLRAKLRTSVMTDLLGTQFYPTLFYPADFYQSSYDAYWQPFELSPQPGDVWMPLPPGGKITGEMISIQLQRSWWSTWVFSNRGWRFSPDSGMQPVSDGGHPASGSMPLFACALLIARNVKTVLPPNALPAANEAKVRSGPPLAPFTLLRVAGQSQGTANSAGAASAIDPQSTKALAEPLEANGAPPPMMVFAFVCTPIGVCPNPDMNLNWP